MSTNDSRAGARLLGHAALLGLLIFSGAVVALHVVQPDLPPATAAVSYYVHGCHGGWLTLGLLGLGAGSLALAGLLGRAYRGGGSGVVRGGLGLWGVGVLAGAVFPADPMGHWSGPPSPAGLVHGVAALVAFVALPAAALALSRGLREDPRWRAAGRRLGVLGVLCAACLAAFLLSLWPTLGAERPPVMLGLTERALLAAYVTWLAATARQGLRAVSVV